MTERLIDAAFYVSQRVWVLVIALIAVAAVNLAARAASPPAHPERVVLKLP